MKCDYKIHLSWGILLSVLTSTMLMAGCGNGEEREIRLEFNKIPDFFHGRRHGGQAFVRYMYARIGDLPDETNRVRILREFTDRLFEVDIIALCSRKRGGRESMYAVEGGIGLLSRVSQEAKDALRGQRFPLVECWEVKLRYLEKERICREWLARIQGQSVISGNNDGEARMIETAILWDVEHGLLSKDDFTGKIRPRFEKIVGRPMRTIDQLDPGQMQWFNKAKSR